MPGIVAGVGVSYGAISRTNGTSAIERSRYQTRNAVGSNTTKPVSSRPSGHLRTWVVLPEVVPEWAHDLDTLWTQAGLAEKRYDAREGRFFDVTWPRTLPLELVEDAITEIYARFTEDNLAVQIDLHETVASDGLANAHLHALISTRAISSEGFSRRKSRDLDAWFRSEGGRTPRRHVADALTSVALRNGIDVQFDPRSNVERGLPTSEDRIRRPYLEKGGAVGDRMLQQRAVQRAARAEWSATSAEAVRISAAIEELHNDLRSKVKSLWRLVPPLGEPSSPLSDLHWVTASADLPFKVETFTIPTSDWLALKIGSSAVIDVGDALCVDGEIDSDVALVLELLVDAKQWKDVSVETADTGRKATSWYRRMERNEVHPGAMPRGLAMSGVLELRSAARSDGLSRTTIERLRALAISENRIATERLIRRLSIMRFGFVPPPSYDDLHSLIDDAARDSKDETNLWEAYKISLDFACMALASTAWGLGKSGNAPPRYRSRRTTRRRERSGVRRPDLIYAYF